MAQQRLQPWCAAILRKGEQDGREDFSRKTRGEDKHNCRIGDGYQTHPGRILLRSRI